MLLMLSVILLLNVLFFVVGKKEKWDYLQATAFECGFGSYFFSRFSFSVHYFMIAMIFLFLDLELCFMFPFMMLPMNGNKMELILMLFSATLTLGLMMEWKEGKLNWVY